MNRAYVLLVIIISILASAMAVVLILSLLPWLGLIGTVLAGVIVTLAIAGAIYLIRRGQIDLAHRSAMAEIAAVVHLTEHGGYLLQAGKIEPLHPASVHVARYKEVEADPGHAASSTQLQLASPASTSLALPGPCDLVRVLEVWRPTREEILLALGPGGSRIVVPLKALCHVALAGATGLGKTGLMRLLLSQLLAVDCRVALADPHFAAVDPESGEDWRHIASRLAIEPAVSYTAIEDILAWLATSELPSRLEKRRNGQPFGEPFFLALDELPAIVAKVDSAPDHMAAILREGRKVGLFLVSAAQDWLVKTIGGSGGVRDCFRTAFYVGGDATSARVLLDVKGTVDDGSLGKGVVMLRSMATPKASLTRIPYASNDGIETLLVPTAKATANFTAFPRQPLSVEGTFAVETDPLQTPLDARALRVRELVKDKTQPSKIIEEVWGVSAKTGGTAYTKAARELSEIMSSLV